MFSKLWIHIWNSLLSSAIGCLIESHIPSRNSRSCLPIVLFPQPSLSQLMIAINLNLSLIHPSITFHSQAVSNPFWPYLQMQCIQTQMTSHHSLWSPGLSQNDFTSLTLVTWSKPHRLSWTPPVGCFYAPSLGSLQSIFTIVTTASLHTLLALSSLRISLP
jgi:hypothetical protein